MESVQPVDIGYDPENKKMYVSDFKCTVSVIDTSTNTVVGNPIKLGDRRVGIAYDPINIRMYMTNQINNTVSVIDTSTNTVVGNPIKLGDRPRGIVYD
jgi:YVTN family beta-propeller protein